MTAITQNSMSKKMVLILAALVMALGAMFTVGAGKADAASTSQYIYSKYGEPGVLSTSDDYMNVYATFDLYRISNAEGYVKFTLMRANNNETWSVVDTKYGGMVTKSFDYGSPEKSVTFSNIAKKGAATYVKVDVYGSSSYTGTPFISGSSKMWIR